MSERAQRRPRPFGRDKESRRSKRRSEFETKAKQRQPKNANRAKSHVSSEPTEAAPPAACPKTQPSAHARGTGAFEAKRLGATVPRRRRLLVPGAPGSPARPLRHPCLPQSVGPHCGPPARGSRPMARCHTLPKLPFPNILCKTKSSIFNFMRRDDLSAFSSGSGRQPVSPVSPRGHSQEMPCGSGNGDHGQKGTGSRGRGKGVRSPPGGCTPRPCRSPACGVGLGRGLRPAGGEVRPRSPTEQGLHSTFHASPCSRGGPRPGRDADRV